MRTLYILCIFFLCSIFFIPQVNSQNESKITDSPLDYIEVGKTTPNCGNGGKTPYIKNTHQTKSIRVNLHVKYKYNGQNMDEEAGYYNLMPNETKKLTSKCTVPGPTNQIFTYYAQSAEWL